MRTRITQQVHLPPTRVSVAVLQVSLMHQSSHSLMLSLTAAFPLFGNQMYETLGFQWASSLLAFLTVIMVPFPYLFVKYGKRIRARSRYATGN